MQGKHHPDLAPILHNLGEVLKRQRNLPGARQYLERAVTITKGAFGDNHPDLATYLDSLGAILLDQGQRIQGRMYLEQALAVSRSQFGPNHSTTREIETNLKRAKVGHTQRHKR